MQIRGTGRGFGGLAGGCQSEYEPRISYCENAKKVGGGQVVTRGQVDVNEKWKLL